MKIADQKKAEADIAQKNADIARKNAEIAQKNADKLVNTEAYEVACKEAEELRKAANAAIDVNNKAASQLAAAEKIKEKAYRQLHGITWWETASVYTAATGTGIRARWNKFWSKPEPVVIEEPKKLETKKEEPAVQSWGEFIKANTWDAEPLGVYSGKILVVAAAVGLVYSAYKVYPHIKKAMGDQVDEENDESVSVQ